MPVIGTVTDIFTDGFAEVTIQEESGRRRCVASNDQDAKRGDKVELEPAIPWNEPIARLAYGMVPFLFVVGILLQRSGTLPERLLAGAILALMAFVVAWLMNRRARLRRRLEFRILRVVEKAPDF